VSVLSLDEAVAALGAGGVVGLPTDTVYGLAARLDDSSAISSLFALKKRPDSVALPVLVSSRQQIEQLGVIWTPAAEALARAFWPGALTIVVPVPAWLARRVHASSDTAGMRMPDESTVQRIIEQTGPLCVTSANEHGQPPCVEARDVLSHFGADGVFRGVVDGGRRDGAVSSVVDVAVDPWELRREGSIAREQLAQVLDARK